MTCSAFIEQKQNIIEIKREREIIAILNEPFRMHFQNSCKKVNLKVSHYGVSLHNVYITYSTTAGV